MPDPVTETALVVGPVPYPEYTRVERERDDLRAEVQRLEATIASARISCDDDPDMSCDEIHCEGCGDPVRILMTREVKP